MAAAVRSHTFQIGCHIRAAFVILFAALSGALDAVAALSKSLKIFSTAIRFSAD